MSYRFDHTAQIVPDIAEAVNWYSRTLPGVKILYQDASWAFLDACGVKLAFVLEGKHPDHLAFRVSPVELERLANEYGKSIDTHRDKTRSFYLEAPGNKWIEIISTEGSTYEKLYESSP